LASEPRSLGRRLAQAAAAAAVVYSPAVQLAERTLAARLEARNPFWHAPGFARAEPKTIMGATCVSARSTASAPVASTYHLDEHFEAAP